MRQSPKTSNAINLPSIAYPLKLLEPLGPFTDLNDNGALAKLVRTISLAWLVRSSRFTYEPAAQAKSSKAVR